MVRVPAQETMKSNLDHSKSSRKQAKRCFKCGETDHFAITLVETPSLAFVATKQDTLFFQCKESIVDHNQNKSKGQDKTSDKASAGKALK
jgi:hypothetical protein